MTARSRDEELAAKGDRLPHKLVIRLNNGTELKAERRHAKGGMTEPFDDADRVSKFTDCCAARLGADATAELYSALHRLDQQANLDCLAPVLA
jgi:hypothetical protein